MKQVTVNIYQDRLTEEQKFEVSVIADVFSRITLKHGDAFIAYVGIKHLESIAFYINENPGNYEVETDIIGLFTLIKKVK